MGIFNITFNGVAGKTISAQLQHDFKLADFIAKIKEVIGDDAYRFVVNGKQLNHEDESIFNAQKSIISNNVTIYYIKRMVGGSQKDISGIIDLIKLDYKLNLMFMETTEKECAFCLGTESCLTFCCNPICVECFSRHFERCLEQVRSLEMTKLIIPCLNCKKIILPEKFFPSGEFINLLLSLETGKALVNNIDCQICTCGTFLKNEALYSQQTCDTCNRVFCFFCNRDWDETAMKNDQFTCHQNCEYENKLTFEMVPMQ
ncbi:unnamed protein product, partial [Didymodactylos carnosus]